MAAKLPQSFIDELLTRTDLVELIEQHVPLKKQGNSYVACCPFHNEKTPSFHVIPKKQFYHCFGCGANGNAIGFIMQYLHQSFLETIETLAERIQLPIPRDTTSEKTPQTRALQQLLRHVTQLYQKNLKTIGATAIAYLKYRGISGTTAHHYQLGYAPAGWHHLVSSFKSQRADLLAAGMLVQSNDQPLYDRFRDRLMFPIHNRHGHIIGFGGRALNETQKPKYLNSPETALFQKHRELYGLYHVLQHTPKPDSFLIVEGYMDVIALAEHGITHAVATLGTATSTTHLHLLSHYTKQFCFCFDGDAAGQKAAWRALEVSLSYLETGLEPSFIFLPHGHDPDSLVREEGGEAFRQRLTTALPLHRFFFDTLLQSVDQHTLSGKSQLLHAAIPYLKPLANSPYQQLMIETLARLTRIEPTRVQQLIGTTAQTNVTSKTPTIKRTPLRIAMALLLQYPQDYQALCTTLDLSALQHSRFQLLKTLITRIATHPTVTTATLIEAWRDTPWFEALHQLITWETHVPEQTRLEEFKAIMLFLNKQAQAVTIQALLEKARAQGLSDEERRTLQIQLAARHQQKT